MGSNDYLESVEKCDKRLRKCDYEVKKRVKDLYPKIRETGFGGQFKQIFGHEGICVRTGRYIYNRNLKKFINIEDQPQ